ncbi:MAG: TIGR03084 family metal-binding protein [Ilumatobacteraceae bacterium]
MRSICDDLAAEHGELDDIVSGINGTEWLADTPSPGWAVRDQISHLWFFDQRAVMALTDTDAFAEDSRWLAANGGTDASVAPGRSIEPTELLARWREDRGRLIDAASILDPSTRVPWYGPSMGARSFITARLMETWAHGQDVVDALGVARQPTARLRHVAHLGVRTRAFAYAVRGLTVPGVDAGVAVRLTAPHGDVWTWDDAANSGSVPNSVTGSALDFCLVVTQRRHVADTALEIVGDAAAEWMSIAQAFAGGVGRGRDPGQFA